MSFLDELSANATNAGRIASQKMKNASDGNKISKNITAEKRNIEQKYSEIGKLFYEKYKDAPDAEFAEQIASITASEQKITELQAELEAVRARKPELISVAEGTPAAPVSAPTAMVCMQCGSTYGTGETFCALCGQKLVSQYANAAQAASAPVQTAEDVQSAPTEEAAVIPTEAVVIPEPAAADTAENTAPSAEASAPAEAAATEAPAAEEPVKAGRFCAYCGAAAEASQVFCAQCGQKL
jgi:uncharacterized Zn finger protein (UPF0148 family)